MTAYSNFSKYFCLDTTGWFNYSNCDSVLDTSNSVTKSLCYKRTSLIMSTEKGSIISLI